MSRTRCARFVGIPVQVVCVALIVQAEARAQCQVDKVTASNADAADRYGWSVAVNGDYAVVGSDRGDGGGSSPQADTGAVYLLQRDGLNWVEIQPLLSNSPTAQGEEFGASVAISDNAEVIVVGALKAKGFDGTASAGAVYVFKRYEDSFACREDVDCTDVGLTTCTGDVCEGLTWVIETRLFADDPAADAGFGFAVDMSGDVIVVGANRTDQGNDDSTGATYVFRRDQDNGAWQLEQKLTASNASALAFFGGSVSVEGNRIAVGATGALGATGTAQLGIAYVFEYDGVTWNEDHKLAASDGQSGDAFGQVVDLYGDTIAVAAMSADPGGVSNAGKVYVYRRAEGEYGDEQILTGSNGLKDDRFGRSASLHGDNLLIGARDSDDPDFKAGSAYLFRYNGTDWDEIEVILAEDGERDDRFAHAVSLSETYGIMSAYRDDDGGLDAGAAYVFAIGLERDCNDNLIPDDCDVIDGTEPDVNNNGTPDVCECQGDNDCGGGDECSTAICNQERLCELSVNAGSCRIDGVCYVDGAANPNNSCQACNASASQDSFTPLAGSCADDGKECTNDVCVLGFCAHQPVAVGTACGDQETDTDCNKPDTCDAAGDCRGNIRPDGTACDDSLFCNGIDSCIGGLCDGHADAPCPGNGQACVEEVDICLCDAAVADSCDDGNICTTDSCIFSLCVNAPIFDCCLIDDPCDDGLFCTGVEECTEGACLSAGDPCSRTIYPNCNEELDSCFRCSEDSDCDDGDPCTIDLCENPRCMHPPASKGIFCGSSSTSLCDQSDFCDGRGNCLANHAANGTLCKDEFFCNGRETCADGVCVAGADPCAGSDFPACDEENDACVACTSDDDCDGDGDTECLRAVCSNGQCTLGLVLPYYAPCGDQRSTPCDGPDLCDLTGSCHNNIRRDGDSCEDALFCTGEDTCQDGVCTHTGNDCGDAGLFCDEQTDNCSETRPTKVIYSNTFGTSLWHPAPSGIRVADDIVTTAVNACKIKEVTIRVNGGVAGGGGQFNVTTKLWDRCPSRLNSSIISGTDLLHEGRDDDDAIDHDLQLLPPGEAIELPPTFWIQVGFSTRTSGWYIGTPATTGFSGDQYNHPFTHCNTWFGGWPDVPHASGYVVVRAEEPCATMFPTYRAISPNAEPFLPPLGPENRVADDLELTSGTCELAAYEVAIRGTAGHYEMSMDLRLAPDESPIPGTRSVFEGKGEGSFEVARFTVPSETVIELPPDVWMTWQANKPNTGVLNVGRTQIGKSESTFALFGRDDLWARLQWDLEKTLPDQEAAFHISIFCRGTEWAGTCCPAQTPEMEPTCDQANPIPASECAFTDTRCGILFDCPAGRWVNRGSCFGGGGSSGAFRPGCGAHACCGFGTCTDRGYAYCIAQTDPNAIDRPCETHLDCPADRLCQSNGICEPEHAVWHSGEFCGEQSFQCPSLACGLSEGDCFSRADELSCVTDADCPSFRRCLTELDVPVCEARAGCGNAACCGEVCGSGPVGAFCCEIAWDSICAAFADETCSPFRGDACFDETNPSRDAIVLDSANLSFEVNNRGATVMEDEPGFACHSVAPGKKGRGSTWLRFQASDTSARIHTCDTPGTAGPSDSLLQVMSIADSKLGVCADGTACNVILRNCTDESVCRLDEQSACTSLTTIGCNDDTAGCGENGLNSDLCVTGLVPNDWYYVLLASKADAHLGPHRVTIESQCPQLPCQVDGDCDDQRECTNDICSVGQCIHPIVDEGTPCGDQRSTPCDRPNSCDSGGNCAENTWRDGFSCEDGLFCTGEDTCLDGICTHTGNDCSDAGPFCDEETDSCSETRPTKVIYRNTIGDGISRSQPWGGRIADDIYTIAVDDCVVRDVSIRVNGGIPGGGGEFLAVTKIWDGCPNLPSSTIIPDTVSVFEGLNDDDAIDHDLQLLPPGDAITLPPTFWIQVLFDQFRARWVGRTPPTTGYSGRETSVPFAACNTWVGGWPPVDHSAHSSGYAIVRAVEPCPTMFPAYRATSPTAGEFVPPLGSENRVADDLELIGGTCELAAYEVALRGTAGRYEASMDLRLNPDGLPIEGTEHVFKGIGDGFIEVARFTVPPETVIELPPKVWMTWQANKPSTGVLNVGRTQIGQSQPTFAGTNFHLTGWARNLVLSDGDAIFHITIFCRGEAPRGACCPAQELDSAAAVCQEDVTAQSCSVPDPRCGVIIDCPDARWVMDSCCGAACCVGGNSNNLTCTDNVDCPGGSCVASGTPPAFDPPCGAHACCQPGEGGKRCDDLFFDECQAITDPSEDQRPCESDRDCPGSRLCEGNGFCEPKRSRWFSGEFCGESHFECPFFPCFDAEGYCLSSDGEIVCEFDNDCPGSSRCLLPPLGFNVCEARKGCSNLECCNRICGSGGGGAFCCDVAWDQVCVGFAKEVCSDIAFPAFPCTTLVANAPPNCAIDARQPSTIDGSSLQGWDAIDVTVGPPGCTLASDDLSVNSQPSGPTPTIDIVSQVGDVATITFDSIIPLRKWSCVSLTTDAAQKLCLGNLPSDVDGDGTSNPALELNALIDCINSPGSCSAWQADIDRSGGSASVLDLTRLIDLFNGAGVYESWTGASMLSPQCPSR